MLPKGTVLLVAVTIIFVGVMLLLGNFGVIPAHLTALWPVILIVSGLIGLTMANPPQVLSRKKKKK